MKIFKKLKIYVLLGILLIIPNYSFAIVTYDRNPSGFVIGNTSVTFHLHSDNVVTDFGDCVNMSVLERVGTLQYNYSTPYQVASADLYFIVDLGYYNATEVRYDSFNFAPLETECTDSTIFQLTGALLEYASVPQGSGYFTVTDFYTDIYSTYPFSAIASTTLPVTIDNLNNTLIQFFGILLILLGIIITIWTWTILKQ